MSCKLPSMFYFLAGHLDQENKQKERWKINLFLSLRQLGFHSTHHFFRNACTKSGSLRFSQFSGCWLILSVYIQFWLSLCKIVRSSVILLLPLFSISIFKQEKYVVLTMSIKSARCFSAEVSAFIGPYLAYTFTIGQRVAYSI